MEHWKNKSIENISEIINGVMVVEQWAAVQNYEGLYEVSSFGRIKKILAIIVSPQQKIRQKISAQPITKGGYLQVTLNKNSKAHTFTVHRLVAKAFIDNPYNKPQVNHKKGIKTDNRVTELEWATRSEDAVHSYRVLGNTSNLLNFTSTNRAGKSKGIVCTTLGISFKSISEAIKSLGIGNNRDVIKVCKGVKIHVKGLHFRYA